MVTLLIWITLFPIIDIGTTSIEGSIVSPVDGSAEEDKRDNGDSEHWGDNED